MHRTAFISIFRRQCLHRRKTWRTGNGNWKFWNIPWLLLVQCRPSIRCSRFVQKNLNGMRNSSCVRKCSSGSVVWRIFAKMWPAWSRRLGLLTVTPWTSKCIFHWQIFCLMQWSIRNIWQNFWIKIILLKILSRHMRRLRLYRKFWEPLTVFTTGKFSLRIWRMRRKNCR